MLNFLPKSLLKWGKELLTVKGGLEQGRWHSTSQRKHTGQDN